MSLYDDDYNSILNMLGRTTTETEQETSNQTTYSPQTDYNPYSQIQDDPYSDDYSVTPNYEEQQSYNGVNQNYSVDSEQETRSTKTFQARPMDTPLIIKDEPTVNLIKKKQKIELQARMKIVATVFAVIVASLMFAIIWNFVSASKMKATFADKQLEIANLQESILGLQDTYTSLSDDGQIKLKAESEGYVEQTDENTINVKLKRVYDENKVEDLPSNWFNDVCDFLSGLFS